MHASSPQRSVSTLIAALGAALPEPGAARAPGCGLSFAEELEQRSAPGAAFLSPDATGGAVAALAALAQPAGLDDAASGAPAADGATREFADVATRDATAGVDAALPDAAAAGLRDFLAQLVPSDPGAAPRAPRAQGAAAVDPGPGGAGKTPRARPSDGARSDDRAAAPAGTAPIEIPAALRGAAPLAANASANAGAGLAAARGATRGATDAPRAAASAEPAARGRPARTEPLGARAAASRASIAQSAAAERADPTPQARPQDAATVRDDPTPALALGALPTPALDALQRPGAPDAAPAAPSAPSAPSAPDAAAAAAAAADAAAREAQRAAASGADPATGLALAQAQAQPSANRAAGAADAPQRLASTTGPRFARPDALPAREAGRLPADDRRSASGPAPSTEPDVLPDAGVPRASLRHVEMHTAQPDPADSAARAAPSLSGAAPAAFETPAARAAANLLADAGALLNPAVPQPLAAAPALHLASVSNGLPVLVELAVPVESAQFRDAFALQVSVLARGGVQHAQVQLNPAELGPISVQIALDGQQAQIHFGCDSAQTRNLVEAGLPALAAALRDAGLTLSGGGVSQHAPGQRHDMSPPREPRRAAAERDDTAQVAARVRTLRVATGRLDTYA